MNTYSPAPRKSSPVKWIAIGCGTLLVLGIGFVVAMIFGISAMMKSSDVYVESLAHIKTEPALVAKLGSPIESDGMLKGKIEVSGPSGTAHISYPVKGPTGKATIYVDASKVAGRWKYESIIAELDGGTRLPMTIP